MKLTKPAVLNVFANVEFYCLLLFLAIVTAPLHELFHAIPCRLAGESPIVRWSAINCTGIFDKSHSVLFVYYMAPYLFYFGVLVALYFLARRWNSLKYLIPIPVLDILFNFFSSPQKSDFSDLLALTFPNIVPFILAIVLVLATLLITIKAYRKFKIYSFSDIIEKYF